MTIGAGRGRHNSDRGWLVYRVRLTSRVLGWLMAFLVSLQGIPGHGCTCAAQTGPAVNSQRPSQAPPKCCCACRHDSPQPTDPDAALHACCRKQDSSLARGGCCCGAACQCRKPDDSPPQSKQIPPESRTRSIDQVAPASFMFFAASGDPEGMPPEGRPAISISGADRCVLLCRFHL